MSEQSPSQEREVNSEQAAPILEYQPAEDSGGTPWLAIFRGVIALGCVGSVTFSAALVAEARRNLLGSAVIASSEWQALVDIAPVILFAFAGVCAVLPVPAAILHVVAVCEAP